MLEQMGVIGQIEEDLAKSDLDGDEDGELSPAARRAFNTTRLAEAKENTGCHGVCQEHRRQALVLIPMNFGRGLRPSFAVSKKSKGTPRGVGVGVGVGVTAFTFMTARSDKVTVQSGWVMEDCWHHMETFSLLTAGPLFKEARVKAIVTEKELASPAVMRSVSQLAVLGHMYKRLQGAAWFVTRWGLQNVVTVPSARRRWTRSPGRGGLDRYLVDITVYARLAEGNGFVSLLVSKLHSAVCRMICQMLAFGHPLAELWLDVLMGFLKAGAMRVLPKNVCETMMRDLLFAQQINRLKAHRLYREPNPNKKGHMAPDDAGPGALETPIPLVGSASAAWEAAVDFKNHLEKLLDDVRRTVQGSHSYAPILAGWGAVLPGWTPSGGAGGSWPTRRRRFGTATSPGFTGGGGGGEDGETSRDNSVFVYKMLKQVPDADPPPYTTTEELESEEELPRNLLAEREDAKYTTMVARAQHFYLATPPPPPGPDSDDSRASAWLIRAALYGPGIRKVDVLMAPGHMSSAKAAGLGVDAGELLVSCKAMGTVRDAKSG
eukprot:jgi/Tetstr1/465616/TSEL_010262.t1